MSVGPMRALGRVFDSVADAYDAGRPGYPDELYRALSEVSGVRLDAATAVDVGAGTGILTHALRARGSRVIAVDPGTEMLARLRSRAAGQAPAAVAAVLADELVGRQRAELEREFPAGVLSVPMRVYLAVGR